MFFYLPVSIVYQSKDRVIITINILFKYSFSIQKAQVVSKIKSKCNIDRPKKMNIFKR